MALGLVAAALPVLAHHSFAGEFDGNKRVTLNGVVTKMDWVNPHAYIYVDVKGDDGVVVNWAIETGAPNVLYRQGWRKDDLKAGDTVTVEAFLAKDGSHTGAASTAGKSRFPPQRKPRFVAAAIRARGSKPIRSAGQSARHRQSATPSGAHH